MEKLDLYRDSFTNTGASVMRGDFFEKGCYTMVIFVCIFNDEGKMLIQRRHPDKSFGGMWDVSAGGAVRSKETSAEAAAREVEEELGLPLQKEELTKVFSLYYDTNIHDIFTCEKTVDISELTFQLDEVVDAAWASKEEIIKMIENGTFIPVYEEFIRLLFRMKTKKGIL